MAARSKPTPKIRIVPLADLVLDKNNTNKGTTRGRELLSKSLAAYGAGRSVLVDKNNKVIAGNKTVEQALAAGMRSIAVIEGDGSMLVAVQRGDLDLNKDERAKQLAVADNRIAELDLNWDLGQLDKMKFDIPMFDAAELKDLKGLEEAEADDVSGVARSDGSLLEKLNVIIEDPKTKVKRGDRWTLGAHILICESVIKDWPKWIKFLTAGRLFCPFAGPLVMVSEQSKSTPLLLVQPDTYIAGHIIDRFLELNKKETVKKVA
jgi:hypothetical protein